MENLLVEYLLMLLVMPVLPFINNPTLVWCFAGLFALLGVVALVTRTRHYVLRTAMYFIAFGVWLAWGFMEREAVIERSNIRVDLLFILPFLYGATAGPVYLLVRNVIHAVKGRGGDVPRAPAAS
jgi:hypothetical protein